jgi:hypothetical protein
VCDIQLGEVALDELDVRDVREILTLPGDEAINDADGVSAANQLLRQVRSDETGAAGDEVLSHTLQLSNIRAHQLKLISERAGGSGGAKPPG